MHARTIPYTHSHTGLQLQSPDWWERKFLKDPAGVEKSLPDVKLPGAPALVAAWEEPRGCS